MLIWGSWRLLLSLCVCVCGGGGGRVCTVLFVSNPTTVLRLCFVVVGVVTGPPTSAKSPSLILFFEAFPYVFFNFWVEDPFMLGPWSKGGSGPHLEDRTWDYTSLFLTYLMKGRHTKIHSDIILAKCDHKAHNSVGKWLQILNFAAAWNYQSGVACGGERVPRDCYWSQWKGEG